MWKVIQNCTICRGVWNLCSKLVFLSKQRPFVVGQNIVLVQYLWLCSLCSLQKPKHRCHLIGAATHYTLRLQLVFTALACKRSCLDRSDPIVCLVITGRSSNSPLNSRSLIFLDLWFDKTILKRGKEKHTTDANTSCRKVKAYGSMTNFGESG